MDQDRFGHHDIEELYGNGIALLESIDHAARETWTLVEATWIQEVRPVAFL